MSYQEKRIQRFKGAIRKVKKTKKRDGEIIKEYFHYYVTIPENVTLQLDIETDTEYYFDIFEIPKDKES